MGGKQCRWQAVGSTNGDLAIVLIDFSLLKANLFLQQESTDVPNDNKFSFYKTSNKCFTAHACDGVVGYW